MKSYEMPEMEIVYFAKDEVFCDASTSNIETGMDKSSVDNSSDM